MIGLVGAALGVMLRVRRRGRVHVAIRGAAIGAGATIGGVQCATLSVVAREHLRATTLDAVARLADLQARGRITAFDFEAKKAELLARL